MVLSQALAYDLDLWLQETIVRHIHMDQGLISLEHQSQSFCHINDDALALVLVLREDRFLDCLVYSHVFFGIFDPLDVIGFKSVRHKKAMPG